MSASDEQKRAPPRPPGASKRRGPAGTPGHVARDDLKTDVYHPIPLEPEPAAEPRRRGSTLAGIPGREPPTPGQVANLEPVDHGPRSVPVPLPLFTPPVPPPPSDAGAGPVHVEPAKTAGPFKVPPPVPASEASLAPLVVTPAKTAQWRVPPAPPPAPRMAVREPSAAAPPVPVVTGSTSAGDLTVAPSQEAPRDPAMVGSSTTGLVAALTAEIIEHQEREEADEALAEVKTLETRAIGVAPAADPDLDAVLDAPPVRGPVPVRMDPSSMRWMAGGWFVAGASVVALVWALFGRGPEREPVVAASPRPTARTPMVEAPEPAAPREPEPEAEPEPEPEPEPEVPTPEPELEPELPPDVDANAPDGGEAPADPPASKGSGKKKPKSKPTPAPEPTPAADPIPAPEPAPKPAPAVPQSAAELYADAKSAYARGDASQAHRLASASWKKSKTSIAAELMVLSSCKQKQSARAERELKLVPLLKRTKLKRDCKAMGISL